MAYEMLYGKTPFKDDKKAVMYNNIMNHKVNKSNYFFKNLSLMCFANSNFQFEFKYS